MSDYYAIVGVPRDATKKDISKAFRAKARKLHPDKQPPTASEAERKKATQAFQELTRAHEVIVDEASRARYDLDLRDAAERAARGSAPPGRGAAAGAAGGAAGSSAARPPGRRAEAAEEDDGWDWKFDTPAQRVRREAERAERERKVREERERTNGLGSHWVKPEPREAGVQYSEWKGWGAGGATRPTDYIDEISEESSELSFNIDLKNIDLSDLVEQDEGWGQAECWMRQPAADKPKKEAGGDEEEDEDDEEAKKKHKKKQQQPACCTLQ